MNEALTFRWHGGRHATRRIFLGCGFGPPRARHMTGNGAMRHLFRGWALLPLLAPAGCGFPEPVTAGIAVGSIVIFHRSPADMLVSVVTGRDCSIVHLDKGERYCRPREQPPEVPVFCTRSLGVADCWAEPAKLPNAPREIADGPRPLTREQEADRAKWWPGL
ncbi:MAG: hypothetical protein EXR07_20110 [Acetobacteraceae bacterium]|nr:hypothetical protein [Acetobacteraceae bacterium]